MSGRDKTVEVGGRAFVMRKMSALDALKHSPQVVRLIAPVIGFMPVMQRMKDTGVKPEHLEDVSSFIPKLDGELLVELTVAFCATCVHGKNNTEFDGMDVDIDTTFDDDIMSAYMLAFQVLSFNYAKYLKGLTLPEAST